MLQLCEEGADGPASCMLNTKTRTKCQCSTFPSYVADSYDTQKYLLCFTPTMQLSLTCPSGEKFDDATSRCEPIPPTTVITTTTEPTTTEPTVSCTEVSLSSKFTASNIGNVTITIKHSGLLLYWQTKLAYVMLWAINNGF